MFMKPSAEVFKRRIDCKNNGRLHQPNDAHTFDSLMIFLPETAVWLCLAVITIGFKPHFHYQLSFNHSKAFS